LSFTGVISGSGSIVDNATHNQASVFLFGNAINGALSFVKVSLTRK
jgi:hypothetical protein